MRKQSKSLVEESSSLLLFSPPIHPSILRDSISDSLSYNCLQTSCDPNTTFETTNDSHERNGSSLGVHPLNSCITSARPHRRVSIFCRFFEVPL